MTAAEYLALAQAAARKFWALRECSGPGYGSPGTWLCVDQGGDWGTPSIANVNFPGPHRECAFVLRLTMENSTSVETLARALVATRAQYTDLQVGRLVRCSIAEREITGVTREIALAALLDAIHVSARAVTA